MGSLHYRRGDYKKAVNCYNLALKYQPELVEAILNRGMALRKLFQFERAFNDFRRAMILAPTAFNKSDDAGSLVELNDIAIVKSLMSRGLSPRSDRLRPHICEQRS
jgi:tetratricopeptide (TPR) repeat protein